MEINIHFNYSFWKIPLNLPKMVLDSDGNDPEPCFLLGFDRVSWGSSWNINVHMDYNVNARGMNGLLVLKHCNAKCEINGDL